MKLKDLKKQNKELLDKFEDLRLLFEKIIEKDEDILHSYLTDSGYIFCKA